MGMKFEITAFKGVILNFRFGMFLRYVGNHIIEIV